ncbi:MAG TPA: hypothetical protein VJB82_00575 [Candidatus Peribacterales bacterium]|nr:hypothetical protein [Candidatus Peribacterales bacterium]
MMTTTGSNLGFIVLWSLHILSVIAFFTGVLFLIVLAVKTFSPTQLKNWAIWLMIGGAVVCLFTIAARGGPWVGGYGRMSGMQMQNMGRMMEMMTDHDAGMNGAAHDEHEEMEEMMREMMDEAGNRPGMMQ